MFRRGGPEDEPMLELQEDIVINSQSHHNSNTFSSKDPHITTSTHSLHSSVASKPPLYDSSLSGQHSGDAWLPGLRSQFPYRGILALFGCLSAIIASIVVLVKSNNAPVSNWTLSPTVYLAFFMTATNMLARFAFHQGAKISWWHKALRGGTLRELHMHWEHADGFWAALGSGRNFNLVTLASLAVTVMVIDQPLIQRASSIISVPRTRMVNVTALIAPEIPYGFTGFQNGRGDYQQVMSQPMIAAFNDYNSQQSSIKTSFTGCSDTCTGVIEAAGLVAKCNDTIGPVIYSFDRAGQSYSPFSVEWGLSGAYGNSSTYMIMRLAFTNESSPGLCAGTRTERTCYLASGTLRYPVTLTRDTLTLGDVLEAGSVKGFQPPNVGGGGDGGGDYTRWTLGGLYLAAQNLFASNATYTFGGGIGTYLGLPDTLSNQFLSLPNQNLTGLQGSNNLTVPTGCGSNWTDPTAHILGALNSIAFRLALASASFPYRNTSRPPPPQSVQMQMTESVNVFKSEYKFLISSTVLTAVFLVLIIPTFRGWPQLGRSVTLNPIETAKAFDAPLLRGPGSNAELKGLVRLMGGKRVRFGEVEGIGGRPYLRFGGVGDVVAPRAGTRYE